MRLNAVRLQRERQRTVVGNDGQLDALQLRPPFKVAVETLEHDAIAARPRHETKRSGSDRRARERPGVETAFALQHVRRQDRFAAFLQRCEKARHERRVSTPQANGDGIRAERSNRSDFVVPFALERIVTRIHHGTPGCDDVGGGERRTVVPNDVMAQTVYVGAAVG